MQAQTLLLIRTSSLTANEANALPRSFQAVLGAHPIIARADVSLNAKEIIGLAVHAGRVLFDAEVVFHERIAPISGSLMPLDQYVHTLDNADSSGAMNPLHPVSIESSTASEFDIEDAEIIHESSTSSTQQTSLAAPQRSIFDRMNDTVLEDETVVPELIHWWDYVDAGQTDVALSMIAQQPRLDHDSQTKARELMQSDDPEKAVFVCFAARQFQWKSWVLSIRKLFTHVDPRVRAAAVSAVGELAGPSLAPSVYPMLSDADPDVRRAAEAAHRKLDR